MKQTIQFLPDNITVTVEQGENLLSAAAAAGVYIPAYCGGDGSEIHWDFIRALFVSVADTAIVPLQDVLGAGGEARMNLPGRPGGNWRWRFAASDLDPGTRKRLAAITDGSGRRPRPGD